MRFVSIRKRRPIDGVPTAITERAIDHRAAFKDSPLRIQVSERSALSLFSWSAPLWHCWVALGREQEDRHRLGCDWTGYGSWAEGSRVAPSQACGGAAQSAPSNWNVDRGAGTAPCLLLFSQNKLELVALLGGLVALLGGRPRHRAAGTLHLTVPKTLLELQGPVKSTKKE
ncbi:hypothetical protein EYF80_036823 [Liparis tanakae]|uniref:Uncharacterized protein n=1 Tax=Liparis tanakae TaxID=230148 RepID=A0A4Z2GHC5_9TELE|nr:hypothetical protein EYF80_036823 [Liparis tanakae]